MRRSRSARTDAAPGTASAPTRTGSGSRAGRCRSVPPLRAPDHPAQVASDPCPRRRRAPPPQLLEHRRCAHLVGLRLKSSADRGSCGGRSSSSHSARTRSGDPRQRSVSVREQMSTTLAHPAGTGRPTPTPQVPPVQRMMRDQFPLGRSGLGRADVHPRYNWNASALTISPQLLRQCHPEFGLPEAVLPTIAIIRTPGAGDGGRGLARALNYPLGGTSSTTEEVT